MTELSNNTVSKNSEVPAKSFKLRILALAIIVVLIAVGVLISRHLLSTKPQAKRRKPAKVQTLVQVKKAQVTSSQIKINAFGKVLAAREITLQARVSGSVIFLHHNFIPGGIVTKGEELIRLDDTDYKLNLQQKKNALDLARADHRIEQGRQKIAAQEWEVINSFSKDLDNSSNDLALRKPQLAKIETSIQSALTDIDKAEIDLDRTVIKAPFNAIVRKKSIDYGSQVSSQSSIATLTEIDEFYVELSLPVHELSWITLPGTNDTPSEVIITANKVNYPAKIINLQPDLDKDGLMAKMILSVSDPLGIKSNKTPLLLGSFVKAEVVGITVDNVFKIPISSLRDDSKVYLATHNNKLRIQPVSILKKDTDQVLIDQGLQQGDLIITSNLSAPINGMELKIDNNSINSPSTSRSKQ